MKRTTLNPNDVAWLSETFERNRARFGGFKMQLDPATPPADPAKTDPKPDDEPLGEGGKRALEAERTARKALEAQVADLAPLKEQMTALAAAFGVKADAGDKGADVLATVQQQLAQIQRENAVLALANEHGITDKSDLDLLKSSALEGDALAGMAARLKPADPGPGLPKPDGSQGGKGEPLKPEALPGVPRLAQAFDEALNNH